MSSALLCTPLATLQSALAGPGLHFDLGAVSMRLHSDSAALAAQVQAVYAQYPLNPAPEWADLHIRVERANGLRRWLWPQVDFQADGQRPFDPFPADSPLPLLEWGGNWLIGRRLNDLLLLHAGTLERDGFALVLPALPGSGKSTLAAALSLRGWRLLSDEFGAWDPAQSAFRALLKPVALKNQSIDLIRRFEPQAQLGPEFPKTRKGTVAHLAATADAVQRRHKTARAGAVILPKWEAGSDTQLVPLTADRMFAALAFNAFNYSVLGEAGFDAVVTLTRRCPGWRLVYSRLDEAIERIDALWPEVVQRQLQLTESGSAT